MRVLTEPNITKADVAACDDDDFVCNSTSECVPASFVCDGQPDCEDSTDEQLCQGQ